MGFQGGGAVKTGNCFFFFFFEIPINLHSFKQDKSKYKASRAGGGESSNHITSSTKPLAYQANEWATELALRRIQVKDT